MELTIHCLQELDSVYIKNRAYEVIYTYTANYLPFRTNIILNNSSKIESILCPHCSEVINIGIRNRKSLFLKQISFLLAFMVSLPISIYLFGMAVNNGTDGL